MVAVMYEFYCQNGVLKIEMPIFMSDLVNRGILGERMVVGLKMATETRVAGACVNVLNYFHSSKICWYLQQS